MIKGGATESGGRLLAEGEADSIGQWRGGGGGGDSKGRHARWRETREPKAKGSARASNGQVEANGRGVGWW